MPSSCPKPAASSTSSSAAPATATAAGGGAADDDVAAAAAASHAWEATDGGHAWEGVREDEAGNLVVLDGSQDTLAQAIRKRRKRQERNDVSQRHRRVKRDMIRYVYVVLDGSRWMRQKDPVLPPGTRLDVTLALLQEFVQEYYDQNPLSHLGFVLLREGEAEVVAPLGTSGTVHRLALQSVAELSNATKGGEFSLQNGLEVAGRSLGHQPRHGSREIVVLTSALSTCDPSSILTETLPKLKRSNIRVSCLALSAELPICRKLAEETNGTMGVCLDKQHFRDWLLQQCVPPPSVKQGGQTELCCEMIAMGFPTRTNSEVPSLVHASRTKTLLARTAFACPQCQAKNSALPTDCAVCGLKLVLAPHLARSFHHLFPVSAFHERPIRGGTDTASSSTPIISSNGGGGAAGYANLNPRLLVSSKDDDTCCYACLKPLGVSLFGDTDRAKPGSIKPSSSKAAEEELLRFQCPDCDNFFCTDCDAYLHETLHNCPGCLCLP